MTKVSKTVRPLAALPSGPTISVEQPGVSRPGGTQPGSGVLPDADPAALAGSAGSDCGSVDWDRRYASSGTLVPRAYIARCAGSQRKLHEHAGRQPARDTRRANPGVVSSDADQAARKRIDDGSRHEQGETAGGLSARNASRPDFDLAPALGMGPSAKRSPATRWSRMWPRASR